MLDEACHCGIDHDAHFEHLDAAFAGPIQRILLRIFHVDTGVLTIAERIGRPDRSVVANHAAGIAEQVTRRHATIVAPLKPCTVRRWQRHPGSHVGRRQEQIKVEYLAAMLAVEEANLDRPGQARRVDNRHRGHVALAHRVIRIEQSLTKPVGVNVY